MFSHIEFCLEEISWEIDALANTSLPRASADALRAELEKMRNLIAAIEAEASTTIAHPARTAARAADDLTLIRGIDAELAKQLADLGYAHFTTIASWTADDIAQMAQDQVCALRIARENWIEQAAILASGGMTHFARQQLAVRSQAGDAQAQAAALSVVELDATTNILAQGLAVPGDRCACNVIDFAARLAPVADRKADAPASTNLIAFPHKHTARVSPVKRALQVAAGLVLVAGLEAITATLAHAPDATLAWAMAALG